MTSKLLTFIGSGLAAFVWGKLITSLDVSAPKTPTSFFAPILVSIVVGVIFLCLEYALKRPYREEFLKIVLDVGLVSLVGSLTILFLFYLVLATLGYAEWRFIFLDLFSVVFLGLMLFGSTFASILILRTIAHFIRLNRQNSLR